MRLKDTWYGESFAATATKELLHPILQSLMERLGSWIRLSAQIAVERIKHAGGAQHILGRIGLGSGIVC